ncbi:beta-glucosidase 13-like [Vigna radiata var. radiata]|uniref:Beta-glucosidase 13-like n=1 Tax=Vigna radiata var. radiata TaxID=3916 RepID=A0A3Q0EYS2_VIGRR|nr:beta-glucosidase 13-like [Vigna radiata var. radiata]
MEILSPLRVWKTILTILSVALNPCLSAKVQDSHIPETFPLSDFDSGFGLSTTQIGETATIPYRSSLGDLRKFYHCPKRRSFPPNFLFGAGTSALQVEGAASEGGRGPGIWDDRINRNKEAFIDGDKFPTMIQHYKRYKEDVQHLKNLGINSYRMSISWSRVLPDGTIEGGVNQEGVDFYNHLIDELLANGITPFVTILHFDYPLAIQEKLNGFLNSSIVNYYKDYCELLFKTYGDRVKHWTTMNEPQIVGLITYMHGFDNDNPEPCQATKLCKQPYTVVHNYILCHAAAVKLYREKFQATQRGEIGIVIGSESFEPYSSKSEDVAAAERLTDFLIGWILDPVVYGDYPKIMRDLVGNRLPNFTEDEKNMVAGSTDFIGINYYTSHFAKHETNKTNISLTDNYDALGSSEDFNAEGKTLGYLDKYGGNFVYPQGLYNILQHIKKKYQNPKIYITENGIASFNITNPLIDMHRIKYLATHLNYTKAAIDDGVRVGGYFVWAAFDTFEFRAGFSRNWGIIHVDFNNNLERCTTVAGKWYKRFLNHVIPH